MKRVVNLLVLPVNTIGLDGNGIFRGWVDSTGDLTVESPVSLSELDSLKVFEAFERLAQSQGHSPQGCAFISTSS